MMSYFVLNENPQRLSGYAHRVPSYRDLDSSFILKTMLDATFFFKSSDTEQSKSIVGEISYAVFYLG